MFGHYRAWLELAFLSAYKVIEALLGDRARSPRKRDAALRPSPLDNDEVIVLPGIGGETFEKWWESLDKTRNDAAHSSWDRAEGISYGDVIAAQEIARYALCKQLDVSWEHQVEWNL
jgi:hypothetical protein